MPRRPAFLAAVLVAAGLAQAAAAGSPTPAIAAKDGWFRYLLPQIPAAGFVTLTNESDSPAVLTGVRSPACGSAMLHRSLNHSGMDMMIHVKSVTIPAHGTFRFSPGAYHIMCMKPRMAVGQTASVTLTFAAAPPLTVPFTVYGADGRPASQ
ncbi:MAG TPA: copper chaperone PCu(A)C [Acidiphilium sp.]|nr:copper chaperone PCu(A)C [Acidiphilium sp.]